LEEVVVLGVAPVLVVEAVEEVYDLLEEIHLVVVADLEVVPGKETLATQDKV
jgi:hypothetical protein